MICVVIPSQKEFQMYEKECKQLYESVQDKINDDSSFEFITTNTFSAVERFAQVIPLNIEEIFLWYFEQKGVDNPERFLIQQGINGEQIENGKLKMENLAVGQVPPDNNMNPENPINQIIKLMSQTKKNFDISDIVSKLKNKKSRKDK